MFCCVNFWSNNIYKNKDGIPIVYLEGEGYYTLSDNSDYDSDPNSKINSNKITIVENFS